MVHIDQTLCIGCGLCFKDCFGNNLKMEDGKAKVLGNCFECGHCVAVCPKNACSIDDNPMDDITPFALPVSPDDLLTQIKSRRSIRHYKEQPVEREKLEMLIETGRFTATGSNAQDVGYVVVQDTLEAVKPAIWEGLNAVADNFIAQGNPGSYAFRWKKMYENYLADPSNKRDDLFFEAPCLLILTGTETSCALAGSNIELMAYSLGLGCLYSGFIRRAVNASPEARAALGLEEKDATLCLLVGFPDISYQRSAPRRTPSVLWK